VTHRARDSGDPRESDQRDGPQEGGRGNNYRGEFDGKASLALSTAVIGGAQPTVLLPCSIGWCSTSRDPAVQGFNEGVIERTVCRV
jgi:hypothetical protein